MRAVAAVWGAALLVGVSSCSDLSLEPAALRITTPITNPSFRNDIAPVLAASCASSGACHAGPTPQQSLNLEAEVARSELVNVPSQFAPSMMLVRPGLPDSSFMLRMLSTDAAYRFNRPRMPLTRYPLPAPVVETIRNWIVNGAADN